MGQSRCRSIDLHGRAKWPKRSKLLLALQPMPPDVVGGMTGTLEMCVWYVSVGISTLALVRLDGPRYSDRLFSTSVFN